MEGFKSEEKKFELNTEEPGASERGVMGARDRVWVRRRAAEFWMYYILERLLSVVP